MAFLSKDVFQYRLKSMQQLMETHELDALVFTRADFAQHATNFEIDVAAWERPFLVGVTKDGKLFGLFHSLSTNHLAMAVESGGPWIENVTFYDEHHGGNNTTRQLPDWARIAAELLSEQGLANGRIGVDASGELLSSALKLLPSLESTPLLSAMTGLKRVKHPEELVLMRKACELCDWIQAHYKEGIRPGRLIQELDFSMLALMVEEAAQRFPGEDFEVRGYALTGRPSSAPHGNSARANQRIQKGDGVVNMIISTLNGVTVESERTYFCGNPTAEQRTYYATALAANEAAIGALRVGNCVCDVEHAARAVIDAAGYTHHVYHRTGHGMGLVNHEWPDDMAYNERPLERNEVYSAEPGLYVPGLGGFRIDDTVVVGDQPEVLTRSPKELESIICSI